MKKKHSVLCIILSLILVFSCSLPAWASDTGSIKTGIFVGEPLSYDTSVAEPSGYTPSYDWTAVFNALKQGIITTADYVDLTEYSVVITDSNMLYIQNYLYNSPELMGFVTGYSVQYTYYENTPNTHYISKIYFNDTVSTPNVNYYDTSMVSLGYNNCLSACQKILTQLLYGVKNNAALSDAEKCMLLHDRLANWAKYDYKNYLANTVPSVCHNAYGALVNRTAVCQGFALAYGWLLDELGIENYYVNSVGMEHGWNKVVLDGKTYYIDVTWDDATWDVKGTVKHQYVLQSYNTFTGSHNFKKLGKTMVDYDININTSDTPADSAVYEAYTWNGVESEILYIDGTYYYVNAAKTAIVSNLKMDGTGSETEIISLADYQKWPIGGGSYYNKNYTKLTAVGNTLYYSTPTDIMAYSLDTEATPVSVWSLTTTALGDPYRIYGLNQINGTLNIVVSNTANLNENQDDIHTYTLDVCTHTASVALTALSSDACKAAAFADFICEDCRYLYTTQLTPGEHTGVWVTVSEATCKVKGQQTRTCTVCQTVENRETEINPDNHKNTLLINKTQGSCIALGYTGDTYCNDCKKTVATGTNALDDTNHVGSQETRNAVTADCHTKGYTGDICCTTCNTIITAGSETPINAANHTGGEELRNIVTATCVKQGYTGDNCCIGCNAVLESGESTDMNPANHAGGTYLKNYAVATCIKQGYTGDEYCSDCNTLLQKGEASDLDPTKHRQTEYREVVKATCIQPGSTGILYCLDCNNELSVAKVIPIDYSNHVGSESEVRDAKAPTCTEFGYTGDTYCLACNHIFTEGKQIDKTAHIDENGDNVCDVCSATIQTTKSSNSFLDKVFAFFNKILAFFRRLLNSI